MNVAIRFSKAEEAKALPIILRHSSGMVLPDRAYILNAAAVSALREAGVRFEELDTEALAPNLEWHARERDPAFLASIARARHQVETARAVSHADLKKERGLE